MNALEAALMVAVLTLIFHFLLQRELARLSDPRNIRKRGVAIERQEVLDGHSEVIGHYRGSQIYAWVVFMGMRYRFDRVVARSYRYSVGEGELFLEPGLIYLTE